MRLSPRSSSAVAESGDANQGGEMEVLMRELDEFHASLASLESISQHRGIGPPRSPNHHPAATFETAPGSAVHGTRSRPIGSTHLEVVKALPDGVVGPERTIGDSLPLRV